MADLAVVRGILIGMAFLALGHFHGGNAISGNDVLSINGKFLFLVHVAMAGHALKTLALMGSMGEVYVIGLPGIEFPGDLAVLGHIFFDEYAFILGVALGRFMAFLALVDPWNSGISSISTERMAGFTVVVLVGDVAEVNGLGLLRIDHIREDHPSHDQGHDKAGQKDNHSQCFVS